MRSAVGAPSVAASCCSSSMLSRPYPVAIARSMLPAPRGSRLSRPLKSLTLKSGPRAGPRRRAHRISWPIRAAAENEDATSTTTTTSASTVVVVDVVPAASSSSAAPPALLPRVPAGGVGTTALEASALPALDAAVSLPVDPSSSASSGGAGVGAAAASPLSAAAPSSAPSTSLFFSVPPAVRGMLAINLGAALFGSNMVAVKLAQGAGASPAALSAGRFALAAAVFLPSAASALWPPQEGGGRESREDEKEKEKEEKEEDSKRRGNPPAAAASPALLAGAGLELGLYLFGGYTGQAIGLSLTTASKGAFASAFTVLAVPILQAGAAALEGGRGGKGSGSSSDDSDFSSPPPPSPPASTWVAAAAAVAGVFLLTSDGGSSPGSGSLSAASTAGPPNLGDLLCVLSAVLFGVHKWRSEQLVEGLSGGGGGGGGAGEAAAASAAAKTEGRDSAGESSSSSSKNEETVRSLVALQLCVLAAASVALCVPEAASAVREALADQRSVFDLASSSSASSAVGGVDFYAAVARQLWSEFAGLPWALFAYMGLFTTAWTIDAEAKALRHVSASTAALIYSSEPLWGAAFAAIFLGERLEGARAWIGAALVVGSSLVAQVGGAAGKETKEKR